MTCYWCSREGCDCKQPARARPENRLCLKCSKVFAIPHMETCYDCTLSGGPAPKDCKQHENADHDLVQPHHIEAARAGSWSNRLPADWTPCPRTPGTEHMAHDRNLPCPDSAVGGVGKAAQACCKQAQPVHHHSSRMWDWCPKHGYTNPADGQEPLPPVHLPMPKSMSMPWCGSDSPTDWVTFTREAATCPGCLTAWDLGVSETPRE
jgi:hypothetical protein